MTKTKIIKEQYNNMVVLGDLEKVTDIMTTQQLKELKQALDTINEYMGLKGNQHVLLSQINYVLKYDRKEVF